MRTTCFIDLDGVMVDLHKGLHEFANFQFPYERTPENKKIIDDFWDYLHDNHPTFWLDLKPMEHHLDLYQKILTIDPFPFILSATPEPYTGYKNERCAAQKKQWVIDKIDPLLKYRTIITKSKKKQEFMHVYPADRHILIDDHPGNIARWIQAGGIAIHHVDFETTMKELEALK